MHIDMTLREYFFLDYAKSKIIKYLKEKQDKLEKEDIPISNADYKLWYEKTKNNDIENIKIDIEKLTHYNLILRRDNTIYLEFGIISILYFSLNAIIKPLQENYDKNKGTYPYDELFQYKKLRDKMEEAYWSYTTYL
jgi:hypothetical protein